MNTPISTPWNSWNEMGSSKIRSTACKEPEDILPNLQMIRMRYQHVKLLLRIGVQCPMPI